MNSFIDLYLSRIREGGFWVIFAIVIVAVSTCVVALSLPYSYAHWAALVLGVIGPVLPEILLAVLSGTVLVFSVGGDLIDGFFDYFNRQRTLRTYRRRSAKALDSIAECLAVAGVPSLVSSDIQALLIAHKGVRARERLIELRESGAINEVDFQHCIEQLFAYIKAQSEAAAYSVRVDDE